MTKVIVTVADIKEAIKNMKDDDEFTIQAVVEGETFDVKELKISNNWGAIIEVTIA